MTIKHDAEWFREQMNQLEKNLTPEDLKWFDELREYILLGALMRDETSVNAQLYAMMGDLLEAETDGSDAIALFGAEPKEMADSLLKQLPPARWQDSAQLFAIIAGISWLLMIISGSTFTDTMSINILTYLAIPAFTVIVIEGLLALVRSQIYATARLMNSSFRAFLVIWASLLVYIAGTFLIIILMPNVLTIPLLFPWNVVLVGGVTVGVALFTIFSKDNMFRPLGFMATVLGLSTLFHQLTQQFHFGPDWLVTGVGVSMIVGAQIVTFIWLKRTSD